MSKNILKSSSVYLSHRTVHNWVLTYTGVPVLLLDSGTTRSRCRRQIQLLLVEKGTCFALWRDVVDNLTRYTSTPDGLFHTFHLSTGKEQFPTFIFMTTNLSKQRFWPCHIMYGLIMTILTIPHKLYASFKSVFLYCTDKPG